MKGLLFKYSMVNTLTNVTRNNINLRPFKLKKENRGKKYPQKPPNKPLSTKTYIASIYFIHMKYLTI